MESFKTLLSKQVSSRYQVLRILHSSIRPQTSMSDSQTQDNVDRTQPEDSHEGTAGGSQGGAAGGPGEGGAGGSQAGGTPLAPLTTQVRVKNLAASVPGSFTASISDMMTKLYFKTEQEAN